MASILASVSVELGANISEFRSAMAQARRELRGVVQAAEAMQDVGKTLSTFVTLPLLAAGAGAVKLAGEFQALEKGFAATYKGAEPLGVALAKVSELAKLPGLGLKEALQGATNLQAAGFSADLAARSLAAFGNALATVGKGKADLEGVGTALSQIASKGKISAEEINQLAERVPQIRQAMKAAFGTADTEVLQKMKISATDFVEGVTKELGKLPKVTGGLQNGFENLADASSVSLAKLGASLNTTFNIEGLLGKAADALNGLTTKFQALSPEAKKTIFVLAGIAAATGPVLFAIGTLGLAIPAITVGFGVLGTAASAAWVAITGPIGLVVLGIAAVGAAALVLRNEFGSFKQAGAAVGVMLIKLATGPMVFLRDALASLGFPLASVAVDFLVGKLGRLSERLTGIVENKVSFSEFFKDLLPKAGGFDGVTGAVYDFGETLTKATVLTKEQIAALANLNKELRLNTAYERVLGDTYDEVGSRQRILETGVKSLTEAYGAGSPVVAKFLAMLRETEKQQALKTEPVALKDVAVKSTLTGLATVLPAIDNSAYIASLQAASAAKGVFTQAMADFNTNTESLLAAFPSAAFSSLGADIGNALYTGADLVAAAGKSLLKSLAGLGAQFGQYLIALGAANVSVPGLQGVGIAQIVAGGALVAAAGVLSGFAGGGGARAGSGGAGGAAPTASIPRSDFTPTKAPGAAAGGPTTITHNVVISASGRDLAAVLELRTDRLGRVVGRPG